MERERLIGWLRTYADSHEGTAAHRDIMRRAADALASAVSREAVIEECAKAIESAPLTYSGPDPHVASDLRYLIVGAIRDLKRSSDILERAK